ncbi:MAG: HD domain-containing protein [Candidatus Hodarchaeota archaeon]
MLRRSLALRLFDAFTIQRWNDKIRPVELTEMDKHAHKMIIAYCLGKYEEENQKKVNWENIIKGGFYEFLRRIVISNIKSPIYRKIRLNHPKIFSELNSWIYEELKSCLSELSNNILNEFKEYLKNDDYIERPTKDILKAAHLYASYWEFQIIKQADPHGYQINDIEREMKNDFEPYLNLDGMRKIMTKQKISNFIDICGRMRFQIRWSQAPRIPKTSVLGHMFLVACCTYLFSRELKSCSKRLYNNFFGGLFHDLPEAVTVDIISPVKHSVEKMPEIIALIEDELASDEIYPLLEDTWKPEIEYFTKNGKLNKITIDNNTKHPSSDEMNKKYNKDKFNPFDGELIRIADDFAAFLEAYVTKGLGINSKHLKEGLQDIANQYQGKVVAGLNIGTLYADFEEV